MKYRNSYFSHSRPELRILIPGHVKRVLDIGCGKGELGRLLKKERPGMNVIGIEQDTAAAKAASAVLDRVILGDAENIEVTFRPGYFDCIIFADVLEHMREPLETARKYVSLLNSEGSIVASIPNISHISIILNLMRHRWPYSDRGLLDRSHLRFFTRTSVIEFFKSLGFRKLSLLREYRLTDRPKEYAHWKTAHLIGKVLLGDFLAYRFFIFASNYVGT